MLIYLLKSSACLAIFMVFYTLFLEKENMHVFKRFYLLGALVLAFAIPFITFTTFIEAPVLPLERDTAEYIFDTENAPHIEQTNYLSGILWSIYVMGIIVFGFLFIKNLIQIILKIKQNPKQKSSRGTRVLLNAPVTPHTFFKYIFLNKRKFNDQAIPQEVFWHEEAHASQNHSYDVLFIELLQVIFWFNPLIYMMKRSIKMNHEFLADQAVLNQGIAAPNYQHILLAFSSNALESPLANAINYSSTRHVADVIKKRFTVMKTHTTKQKKWIRSLVLLPLCALTFYGFAEKKEILKLSTIQNSSSGTIQHILIYIDESDALTLNGNGVAFEDLVTEVNKLNPHLTKTQKENYVSATIHYENASSISLSKKISSLLFQTGVSNIGTANVTTLKRLGIPIKPGGDKYNGKTLEEANAVFDEETIDLSPPKPMDPNSPWQIGVTVDAISFEETKDEPVIVTSEMMAEYNSIVKSINSQPETTRTAKLKDFNRLSEIYSRMSALQKQVSEPFPSLPNYTASSDQQKKATPAEIAEYNKLVKQINSQNPNKTVITQKVVDRLTFLYGKMSKEQKAKAMPFPNFPPPPPPAPPTPESKAIQNMAPPPPPPPVIVSPEDLIDEMKNKGALFLFNDKEISAEEAKIVINKHKKYTICTSETDSQQPVMTITTEPEN